MPSEKEVYESHAAEYEALVSREDYQGNILRSIREIVPLGDLDVLDLGAGTGRLACLLAPCARSVLGFDLSAHMLGVARDKLRLDCRPNWLVAVADHRFLPLQTHSADLILSGWSVSYLTIWNPDDWHMQADLWLREAQRILRKGGTIILFESLGTGNETPQALPHLENFYRWMDEKGFLSKWIRTDYRFGSVQEAAHAAGFFFGDELKNRIQLEKLTSLPECTGVWWLRR